MILKAQAGDQRVAFAVLSHRRDQVFSRDGEFLSLQSLSSSDQALEVAVRFRCFENLPAILWND